MWHPVDFQIAVCYDLRVLNVPTISLANRITNVCSVIGAIRN